MPLTYDQISAITNDSFIPKLYDNIFESTPLLKRGKEKFYKKISGGNQVRVPLNYAMSTAAGSYSGADSLSVTDNDVLTSAFYSWKQYYANVIISGRDERINSGDAAILDFVASKVEVAEKTLADLLSTGLYSDGTDTKAFVGLRDIVAIDQTVGGISQTTYSWWQGKVDSTTTTLSLSAMQTQFNAASVGPEKPSVITTGRTIFNLYWNLLQPQQRFTDSKTADAGFDNLMFNSTPVIVDAYCPSSHLFMLNEKYLHLIAHKDCDFKFVDFVQPIGQDVKVAKVLFMGAFASSNNRMHAKMSAITA